MPPKPTVVRSPLHGRMPAGGERKPTAGVPAGMPAGSPPAQAGKRVPSLGGGFDWDTVDLPPSTGIRFSGAGRPAVGPPRRRRAATRGRRYTWRDYPPFSWCCPSPDPSAVVETDHPMHQSTAARQAALAQPLRGAGAAGAATDEGKAVGPDAVVVHMGGSAATSRDDRFEGVRVDSGFDVVRRVVEPENPTNPVVSFFYNLVCKNETIIKAGSTITRVIDISKLRNVMHWLFAIGLPWVAWELNNLIAQNIETAGAAFVNETLPDEQRLFWNSLVPANESTTLELAIAGGAHNAMAAGDLFGSPPPDFFMKAFYAAATGAGLYGIISLINGYKSRPNGLKEGAHAVATFVSENAPPAFIATAAFGARDVFDAIRRTPSLAAVFARTAGMSPPLGSPFTTEIYRIILTANEAIHNLGSALTEVDGVLFLLAILMVAYGSANIIRGLTAPSAEITIQSDEFSGSQLRAATELGLTVMRGPLSRALTAGQLATLERTLRLPENRRRLLQILRNADPEAGEGFGVGPAASADAAAADRRLSDSLRRGGYASSRRFLAAGDSRGRSSMDRGRDRGRSMPDRALAAALDGGHGYQPPSVPGAGAGEGKTSSGAAAGQSSAALMRAIREHGHKPGRGHRPPRQRGGSFSGRLPEGSTGVRSPLADLRRSADAKQVGAAELAGAAAAPSAHDHTTTPPPPSESRGLRRAGTMQPAAGRRSSGGGGDDVLHRPGSLPSVLQPGPAATPKRSGSGGGGSADESTGTIAGALAQLGGLGARPSPGSAPRRPPIPPAGATDSAAARRSRAHSGDDGESPPPPPPSGDDSAAAAADSAAISPPPRGRTTGPGSFHQEAPPGFPTPPPVSPPALPTGTAKPGGDAPGLAASAAVGASLTRGGDLTPPPSEGDGSAATAVAAMSQGSPGHAAAMAAAFEKGAAAHRGTIAPAAAAELLAAQRKLAAEAAAGQGEAPTADAVPHRESRLPAAGVALRRAGSFAVRGGRGRGRGRGRGGLTRTKSARPGAPGASGMFARGSAGSVASPKRRPPAKPTEGGSAAPAPAKPGGGGDG